MLKKLHLYVRVLMQGCRSLDFVSLKHKCAGCKYDPICFLGRYNPR
jgi:hypothetical protein